MSWARNSFAACRVVQRFMIEVQVAPKTMRSSQGRGVVSRSPAVRTYSRCHLKRGEKATTSLILARQTRRRARFLDEGFGRAGGSLQADGRDILSLKSLIRLKKWLTICNSIDGVTLANMLEGGQTPILRPSSLRELGFSIARISLTLLSCRDEAMKRSLRIWRGTIAQRNTFLEFAGHWREAISGFAPITVKANELSKRAKVA